MQKPVKQKNSVKKSDRNFTPSLHIRGRIQIRCTTYGPIRWTASWTRSMDYPCGPRLIFVDEFNQRSKHIFGILNGRECGHFLLSVVWAPHILYSLTFFSSPYQLDGFVLVWWRSQHILEGQKYGGSSILCSLFRVPVVWKSNQKQLCSYETKDKILFLLPGLTKKIKPINGIPEKFEQVYNMRNL